MRAILALFLVCLLVSTVSALNFASLFGGNRDQQTSPTTRQQPRPPRPVPADRRPAAPPAQQPAAGTNPRTTPASGAPVRPGVFAKSALPFTQEISVTNPVTCNNQVGILQNLLVRSDKVRALTASDSEFNACYDAKTSAAVTEFQRANNLNNKPGVLDEATAIKVITDLLYDKYVDGGYWPNQYQWKVHVPVYKNRDLDTVSKFSIRPDMRNPNKVVDLYIMAKTAGQYLTKRQPQSGNTNDLSPNGATPSGLMTIDFVTPNMDLLGFGPWPINRVLRGLKGNAAIKFNLNGNKKTFVPHVRNGVYYHTGYWGGWRTVRQEMPVSHGCVHVHPAGIKHVYDTLMYYGIRPTSLYQNRGFLERGLLSVEVMNNDAQLRAHEQYKALYARQDNQIVNNGFIFGRLDDAAKARAAQYRAAGPDAAGPNTGARNPTANVYPPPSAAPAPAPREISLDSIQQEDSMQTILPPHVHVAVDIDVEPQL
jgi:hypothetical protein